MGKARCETTLRVHHIDDRAVVHLVIAVAARVLCIIDTVIGRGLDTLGAAAGPIAGSVSEEQELAVYALRAQFQTLRAWEAAPLRVAVCCADADELARAHCEGLDAAITTSTFWHVARVAQAD